MQGRIAMSVNTRYTVAAAAIPSPTRPLTGAEYLDSIGIFIFCAGSVSSYRNGGRGCPVHTGEEWTVRRRRGTTTVPSQSSPPHSVDADAGSTRTGLECLSANLCRSLGGVSAYPSALSDAL